MLRSGLLEQFEHIAPAAHGCAVNGPRRARIANRSSLRALLCSVTKLSETTTDAVLLANSRCHAAGSVPLSVFT